VKGHLTFDFNELTLNSIVCAPRTSTNRSRKLPFQQCLLPSSSRHLRHSLDVTELILSRNVRLTSTANFYANSSGRAFRSKISRVALVVQSDPLPFSSIFISSSSSSASSSCFTITFSAGATSLPKLYELYELFVRLSQLLYWELTGQHSISNKACHRVCCLISTYPCLP